MSKSLVPIMPESMSIYCITQEVLHYYYNYHYYCCWDRLITWSRSWALIAGVGSHLAGSYSRTAAPGASPIGERTTLWGTCRLSRSCGNGQKFLRGCMLASRVLRVIKAHLLRQFRTSAEQLYNKVTQELPFDPQLGLSTPSALANSAPDIPVFVVNLDRSPHRPRDI